MVQADDRVAYFDRVDAAERPRGHAAVDRRESSAVGLESGGGESPAASPRASSPIGQPAIPDAQGAGSAQPLMTGGGQSGSDGAGQG